MSIPLGGGVGPQVNKFGQVSDDHQMSVVGGGGNLTRDLSHDVFDVIAPPPPGQIDACESITSPNFYGFQIFFS